MASITNKTIWDICGAFVSAWWEKFDGFSALWLDSVGRFELTHGLRPRSAQRGYQEGYLAMLADRKQEVEHILAMRSIRRMGFAQRMIYDLVAVQTEARDWLWDIGLLAF